MASSEHISINILPPGDGGGPTNLCVWTSTSLDGLQHSSNAPLAPRHSYSDAAIAGPETKSNSSSPSSHSPTSPHRHLNKLYKFRDELEHVYSRMKKSAGGCKFSRKMSQIRNRLHHQIGKEEDINRRIKVEFVNAQDGGNSQDEEEEDGDTLELPDHNYSPSLLLTDLRDGCFSAELPLNVLPTGQITIRIRNYKMEIIVGRRSSLIDDKHCISCPVRYGDIDIPIYVNPATLEFAIDDASGKLHVMGYTKGYSRRSFSVSDHHDLPLPKPIATKSTSLEALPSLSRSRSAGRSIGKPSSPRRSLTVSHSPSNSFRRRARTH